VQAAELVPNISLHRHRSVDYWTDLARFSRLYGSARRVPLPALADWNGNTPMASARPRAGAIFLHIGQLAARRQASCVERLI
jgi:hypothetical protein